MRDLTLAVLALASAFLPNIAPAHAEWVHVIGGKLSSSGPPFYFQPNRVNILVTNLPAGWPPRAGQCRTLTHENAPKVRFAFTDGLTTGEKLVARGYALDGSRASKPPVFPGRTYIKLCRDTRGNPAAFTIQAIYYRFRSNVIDAYSIYAENSAGGGRSSVGQGSLFNGSAGTEAPASSKVKNLIKVQP